MSNYRDDSVDVISVAEEFICGQRALIEEQVYVADALRYNVRLLTDEPVQVGDESYARLRLLTDEALGVQGLDASRMRAGQSGGDTLRIGETVIPVLAVRHDETLGVTDVLLAGGQGAAGNPVQVDEAWLLARHSFALTVETLRVGDGLRAGQSVLVEEQLGVSDEGGGRRRSRALIEDTLHGEDAVDERGVQHDVLTERVRVVDEVFTLLHAQQLVVDELGAQAGEVLRPVGQAWVSAVDRWAMSRYAPYSFDSLTLIDGVLHATGEGGVYCLQGEGETITCTLSYGTMDVGGSPLTLPAWAYLGCVLEGEARMSVTQTQNRVAQTWSYPFQSLNSEVMRNGRFVFGKGLRGRYFKFELVVEGEAFVLDDLTLMLANKTRRI